MMRERSIDEAKKTAAAMDGVMDEVDLAMQLHGPQRSHHEAYALIAEELDEYWEQVKLKEAVRDKAAIREELTQIAAMAVRAIVDLDLLEET